MWQTMPILRRSSIILWNFANRKFDMAEQHRATLGFSVAAAIVLSIGVANAQLSPLWQTCTGNPDVGWDQQIKSCTALIESGTEAKQNQAIAFFNRALAYENKDDYARAIADFSEAILLDPNDADAWFYRSLDKGRTGDKAGAEADLAAARRLNPNIGK